MAAGAARAPCCGRPRPVDIPGLRRPAQQSSPAEQRWLFLHRYAYPLGCTRTTGRTAAFASFDLRHDERVHGSGEGFGRLDKVGTAQRLWVQEAFSNASPAAYKQVPWYWSTRGYGMLVHTTNPVLYRVGDLEHSALSVVVDDVAALDLFVVAAPTLRAALPRCTALTGAPAVPPRWSLGLWMSRITYRSQREVEDVAAQLRAHRVPCGVIHVDTGWFDRDYVCDLRFSPDRFPDPAGMCARLAEQGFRVSVWQWPNYDVGSPLFDEGVAGGRSACRGAPSTPTTSAGSRAPGRRAVRAVGAARAAVVARPGARHAAAGAVGLRPEVEDVVRRWVELRYRLLAHLWTLAVEAGRTSLPVVRPLLLEFPDDPVGAGVDDQYLLGDRLLAAPVLEGARARRVYLPPGAWVDRATGERVEGGRHLTVDAPLDAVPLFHRGDTVLPLGPVVQHVDQQWDGPLELVLAAPATGGEYTLLTGRETVRVVHGVVDGGVEVRVDGAPGPVALRVVGAGPFAGATVDGRDAAPPPVPGGVVVAAEGDGAVRLRR